MPASTVGAVYGPVARSFHWLLALLLLGQIPLAFYMTGQTLGPDKLANYATHKSIGLLLFTLTALRLAWRLTHAVPPLPVATPAWQRLGARSTQGLLYLLLFLMPVSGVIRSQAANFQVSFFGLFTLPPIVAPDPVLSKNMAEVHEMQGAVLLALIALHTAGALYHHFVRRDTVLRAMLPLPGKP